jgi:tRNA 2-thiouridine synthesizing protein A
MKQLPNFHTFLNASGWLCPQPLLQAKKKLQQLAPGDILKIRATDPSSIIDFNVFIETSGNKLIFFNQQSNYYEFWICKKLGK